MRNFNLNRLFALTCFAMFATFAFAEELNPERIPAPFMSYHGAPWLERHDREEQEMPDEVVAAMKLEPGDVVADIGCGTGYFARRIAKKVLPGGKVYGVDIQPEMIDLLMKEAEKAEIENIVPVLSAEDDPKLPKGEIDWMILVDVYHEFSEPEKMLAKMREALAPGGRIALVEYRNEDGTGDHIKPDHRMSARQVMLEWEAAGFELAELREFLPHQHLFILRATGGDGADEVAIKRMDLVEAVEAGKVKLTGGRAEENEIVLNVERTTEEKLLITAPAGLYFRSPEGNADRVAHRDGALGLFEEGAKEMKILAVAPNAASESAPKDFVRYTPEPVSRHPNLRRAMFYIQMGGLPLDTARAAARILATDPSYDQLEGFRASSIGLALLACDQAEIELEKFKIWTDREKLLNALGSGNLKNWLTERAGAPIAK